MNSHSWMGPSLNPSASNIFVRAEMELRVRFLAVRVMYPGKEDLPSVIRLSNLVTPVLEMSRVSSAVRLFRAVRSLMRVLLRFRVSSAVRPVRLLRSETPVPLRSRVSRAMFGRLDRLVTPLLPLRFRSVTPVKRASFARSALLRF